MIRIHQGNFFTQAPNYIIDEIVIGISSISLIDEKRKLTIICISFLNLKMWQWFKAVKLTKVLNASR